MQVINNANDQSVKKSLSKDRLFSISVYLKNEIF